MAIGFTPKYIEERPLNNYTQEQYLALAIETAKKLHFKIAYLSKNGLIASTDNGMFKWNAELQIKIQEGVVTTKSSSTGNEMIDLGKNKKNVDLFLDTLNEIKSNYSKEELDSKFLEINENLVPDEEDLLLKPPLTTVEKAKEFFAIFTPIKGYFITPILLDINILLFIIMVLCGVGIMEPSTQDLLNWGANFKPLTLDGQWWRIITNCFLHIGIFHLLMNMYALLYIGVLLEPILGKTRFASAYILTGIVASMASLWWHDLTVSAGASGAIFGMYGVFLSLLSTDLIEKEARKPLLLSISIFVGYNLLNGLKGGIDNSAHIGGLISGIIIGYAMIPSLKKPEENKLKLGTIALLSAVVLLSSFTLYNRLPNDIGKYDTQMKKFVETESLALKPLNQSFADASKRKLIDDFQNKGIYYWKKNIQLIDDLKKLDLPEQVKKRNQALREYCELRIKSYELIIKSITDGSDKYNNDIVETNYKIKNIISSMQRK